MKMKRTKNAVRNIIWGVIEKCTTLLLPFFTRTILIKVLGSEYLGLNSLFTSILSVLSVSELGIGTAIVFSMYKPVTEDDNETLCALLNLYKKMYHIIGIIILGGGLIVAPFLPYLIEGTYPADINIYVLYFIYLINTVLSYFLFAYKTALFSAFQRNDLASKRTSVITLISNILQITMLVLARNYYTYVIVVPLTTIMTNVANAILAGKMFPNIVCRGQISKALKKEIKKRVVGLISFKIYNVVFASVDTIVISAFLGLTPLAIYNNYYYVQNAIVGFLVIVSSSITAGIGNKMVTNSREDNYQDFKNFTFANGWICSWCAVCLFCLYQHFMNWWLGEGMMLPFGTMTLMVFYFLLPRITTMTYTYREAAGLWWEDRFRPIVATVANLTLNLILVRFIGMNGVIISTLLCTILINVPWGSIILFDKYFKTSPVEYFRQILFYVAVTCVVAFVTWMLCGFLPSTGFGIMLLKGVLCVVVPNILFLLVYHKLPEFQYTKQLVQRILNRMINWG